MGSLFSARDASAPAQDDLVSGYAGNREGLTQGKFVLGERARLVRAKHIHARQFFDGRQAAHDGLLGGEHAGAYRHGDRQDGRHGHGDCGHGEHQRELKRGHHLVAAEKRDEQNQHHQRHGEDDEVVPDFQNRLLKVADRVGFRHQAGGLAEVGVLAGALTTASISPCLTIEPE